jgi:hypothetical protein
MKLEAPMRAVIVELPAGVDLIGEMRKIRTWIENHRCEPTSFKYHLNGNNTLIVLAEFIKDPDADLFKMHFNGLESEFVNLGRRGDSPETMATACWWRLKAEEIRTEYDGFACQSARETMAGVASCYDMMAVHLENRLTKEAACLSPDSSHFGRFAFR